VWEFLKPALRGLKLIAPSTSEKTHQQLAIAQQNTLKNIHGISTQGKTPTNVYLAQLKSDKYRQTHSSALSNSPDFAKSPSMTLTKPELKKASIARQQYSYEVMDHVSNTAPSPLLERSHKVTFSDQPPAIHKIERLVPIPVKGWRKATETGLPKRPTLWSRRTQK
jgi:hypothetical protein